MTANRLELRKYCSRLNPAIGSGEEFSISFYSVAAGLDGPLKSILSCIAASRSRKRRMERVILAGWANQGLNTRQIAARDTSPILHP
jgi:hypothetical protein